MFELNLWEFSLWIISRRIDKIFPQFDFIKSVLYHPCRKAKIMFSCDGSKILLALFCSTKHCFLTWCNQLYFQLWHVLPICKTSSYSYIGNKNITFKFTVHFPPPSPRGKEVKKLGLSCAKLCFGKLWAVYVYLFSEVHVK